MSIVVPCFNVVGKVEPLLRTLADAPALVHEIVFVDDGSTDATAAQLTAYCAGQDDRYRAMTIENAGPGGARNRGADVATGDYVWFVDADDDLDLAPLAAWADVIADRAPDVVEFDFIERGAPVNAIRLGAGFHDLARSPDARLTLFEHAGHVVTKLIRRSLIERHALRFPERYFYEDLAYTVILALVADTLLKVESPAYSYVEELPSVMRGPITWRFFDRLHTTAEIIPAVRERQAPPPFVQEALRIFDFLFVEQVVRFLLPRRPLLLVRVFAPLLGWRRAVQGPDARPAFARVRVRTFGNALTWSAVFALWCACAPLSLLWRDPKGYFDRMHDRAWSTTWKR